MTELPEVLPATGTAGLAWLLFVLPALGAVLLLLAGLVLAALSKPSRALTARMLDRTFGLQERLSTALDDLEQEACSPGDHRREEPAEQRSDRGRDRRRSSDQRVDAFLRSALEVAVDECLHPWQQQ